MTRRPAASGQRATDAARKPHRPTTVHRRTIPTVFLDRDGTINLDQGHTHRVTDLGFLPGAVRAIRLLNEHGFKVIVVTNQSGIGRGYYTERHVERFHDKMNAELKRQDARIDAFYHCPHHPEAARRKYRIACRCRKPGTLLFQRAIRQHGVDVSRSFMIGDSPADMEAGRRVGLTTIYLRPRGYERAASPSCAPDFTATGLLPAVRKVLRIAARPRAGPTAEPRAGTTARV